MPHFLQMYFKGRNYSIVEETFAVWPFREIFTFRGNKLSLTPEIFVFCGNELSWIGGSRYNENKLEHSKFAFLLKLWCFSNKNHGLMTKSGQWS